MLNQDLNRDIVAKIKKISDQYDLHIDQMGILVDEVSRFISGKINRESFVENLIENLGVDVNIAVSVASDISLAIFADMRNSLSTEEKNTSGSSVAREDILSAIENPAPTEHPISIAQPKPLEKTRPSSEATEIAHAFIGEKLSAPVSLPSQKTVITPTPTSSVKQKPSVDPYREPIN